ncbi:hypothetical protein AX768_31140 (plasmid) [Burkholderia sp. PAMC 28687]|nr:hypothetical protein AX768_31140 [Burkholderia sp. PAMC 28687]
MPNVVPADMPKEVKKHIAAVHIRADLSAVERKLINVLLLNAIDQLKNRDIESHTIPVPVLCAMIGWEDSKNVQYLKVALKKLAATLIEFDLLYDQHKGSDKKRSQWGIATLLSGANITDGICSYRYDIDLRQQLADPEIYAIIDIGSQAKFSSSYALALYENCVRFKGTGSTGAISLYLWRCLLGLDRKDEATNIRIPSAYDEFKHFNNQIIKPAIREINSVSNIHIEPEYVKDSRKVVAIRFSVAPNPQLHLTDGQRDDDALRETTAYKLLRTAGVGDKAAVNWIASEPERALEVAQITTARMARGLIKQPAAYASRLFTNGSELTVVTIDDAITEQAREPAESKEEEAKQASQRARDNATREAVRTLTLEQRRELANGYIATGAKVTTYRADTVDFSDAAEKMAFMTWMRAAVKARMAA